MAEKIKYDVNRSMQDGAKSYDRGDTREMTEAEAKALVASGALSLPGKKPAVRPAGVEHTFGSRPSKVNDEGYTSPTGEGIALPRAATPKPAKATTAKP